MGWRYRGEDGDMTLQVNNADNGDNGPPLPALTRRLGLGPLAKRQN